MSNIYRISYCTAEEYTKKPTFHSCFVCVYDSTEVGEGETIQYALDKANEDDDWSGVDMLMYSLFKLKDEDICYYFDISDIKDEGTARMTRLVPELQKNYDIVIDDIWVEQ